LRSFSEGQLTPFDALLVIRAASVRTTMKHMKTMKMSELHKLSLLDLILRASERVSASLQPFCHHFLHAFPVLHGD